MAIIKIAHHHMCELHVDVEIHIGLYDPKNNGIDDHGIICCVAIQCIKLADQKYVVFGTANQTFQLNYE